MDDEEREILASVEMLRRMHAAASIIQDAFRARHWVFL